MFVIMFFLITCARLKQYVLHKSGDMKKGLIILCLCVSSLSVWAQQENLVQEAMADYDYEKVIALVDEVEFPAVSLLYQKGRALKGLGQTTEALEVFQALTERDSLNPRAYIEAAECSKALVKYDLASRHYRKALALNPDNKYVRLQYINLLLGRQRFHEALAETDVLLQKDSSAYVLQLKAESMERLYMDADSVIALHRTILGRYPRYFISAAKLGNIYIAGGMYPEAVEVTEQYRSLDSTNLLVNRVNAQAYCLAKDYPMAIRRYEQLLQEQDSSFHTCFYGGISHYATEDYYKAHDLLERALRDDANNVNVLYYLGRACAKSSWKKEGVGYLEKAIDLSVPADSAMQRLYVGLIDCYKMARRYREQAESILELYDKYDREKHKLLYDAATVYQYMLKDSRKAEALLVRYLKTKPKTAVQLFEADGTPVIDEHNRYNAAENWLNDLRRKRKEEEFFKGE